MQPLAELLWRILPSVRRAERSRVAFFTGLFTLISAAQTLGIAGSEALLLAEIGAESLPMNFIAASLVTVVGTILYAARVGEARNDDLFVQMLLASAVVLGVGAVVSGAGSILVLPALFCFFYLTQSIFLNHFWTFSGDYFDTLTSKRLFPVFTVGASIGGMLGGFATMLVARFAGPSALIAGWGLLLGVAALQLRLLRRPLRRWGPLELEEADETSVEGIQGAVRYVRGSALGRWLVLSSLGMVLAIFIAQYLYSDIFARAYPEPSDLAAFFGLYLAATNAIEILLELLVTPWLIRRFGVATSHLVHPILTFASFGGLASSYGLYAGIAARANRELVENAIAAPIRTLVYNALPPRFRGRIRAFLEGIVVYAGMSAAGLILVLLGDPDPRWLCAAGAIASGVYLFANLAARREYLQTLIRGIRAGRLDLSDLDDEIGEWEATRLADLCDQLLAEETGRPSRSLRQIVPVLAQRGLTEPLVRGASHPNAEMRRTCVEALGSVDTPEARAVLLDALTDPEPNVRLTALVGLAAADELEGVERALESVFDDPDPRVRAEAAALRGEAGHDVLQRMLRAGERDDAIAALRMAPEALAAGVTARTRDPDPEIRAAALDRAARLDVVPLETEELIDALDATHAGVRRGAVFALSRMDNADALAALAAALADTSADVQRPAIDSLAAQGEAGVEAALPYLRDDSERGVEGALRVIASSGLARHRELLSSELRHRVRQLWFRVAAYQRLPEPDSVPATFMRVAYADALMRSRRLAFLTLELLENERIIRKVAKAVQFGSSRARADALEVLSNLGDREASQLLVLLHERGSFDEKLGTVHSIVTLPPDFDALLDASRRSEVPWIRMAAEALGDTVRENPERLETMERLLALKQVPLFSNLTLEQLEAVNQLTRQAIFLSDEVVVRQGDMGGELYLLLEGTVEVWLDHGLETAERVNVLEAVTYFGEMAILDDEPRSASIVARDRSRLLVLDGGSLKELILQIPDISFEIFRVLTARVRAAERRLSER